MKPVAYIGADPGMSGALACYLPAELVNPTLLVVDMPAHEIDGKREMDHWGLATLLDDWSRWYEVRTVVIERVHSMPKHGVTSSFNFGASFGALKQAVASAGLHMVLIPPQTWKAIYGLRGGKENKDMSRQKASQIFPASAALWARKKDDGRAEAALLAHYGSKLQ